MWRKILIVVASVMLVAGLGLLLFPPISNFIGAQLANHETDQFDTQIENISDGSYADALADGKIDKDGYPVDKDGNRTSDMPLLFNVDIEKLYQDSLAYNQDLKQSQSQKLTSSYAYENASLNLSQYGITNGIYGYVYAPSIDMKLPIYLGANDSTMSYGAAHLTYTSLPIGGNSTNAVIAGHTGYIGRIFFDNLRNLQIGDEVNVKNYWSTLKYTVAETKVIKPDEAEDIFIKQGEDRLTLLTCISDGNGGFNRYMVICKK